MMKIHPTLFLTALLLFAACHSTRHTPETFSGRQIHFGSGGGFTGMVKTWCLLEDGQLYVKEEMKPGEGTFSLAHKIKKKTTRQVFDQAQALDLEQIDFQHPGNMYSFVAIGTTEAQHRITWGAADPQPAPEIQAFYQSLQGLTQP